MDTKALKQKILDLAIRGKLVPQDPNDEPASVLLERIRAQKQQMVKEGKLKAADIKNDSVIFVGEDSLHYEKFHDGTVKCIEDEIPFELPQGWGWTRLGVIFSHNTGKALNKANTQGTLHTYITTSNVYWGRFELDNLKLMHFSDAEIEKCTVKKGDLLVCEGGDIGRSAIWEYDEDIRIQNHIHRLRPYVCLNVKLYYYIFYLYKLSDRISGKGIGIQGLSSNQLHNIIIPLPPFPEQTRIVSKINELLSFIDIIESEKNSLLSIIDKTKSKILDLAIRGKLVPQDPTDEPASVLLERIRLEKEELIKQGKIKRDKKESVIFRGEDNSYYEKIGDSVTCIDDELPFEIPNGWIWCNLSMMGQINIGLTYSPADIDPNGIMVLRSSNIINSQLDFSDLVKVNTNIRDSQYVKNNDILICARNGSKALVGKCALIENLNEKASFGAFMAIYRTAFYRYVFYFLQTSVFREIFYDGNSTAINQLTQAMIKSARIPLPPIEEQNRITICLKECYKAIDQIEKSLS